MTSSVFLCVQPDESSLDFSSCVLRHGIKNAKELACGVCLLNVDARSKVRAHRSCSEWPSADTPYQSVHIRSRRLTLILTLEHLQNKEESTIGRLFKRVWDSQLSNKSLSLWGRIFPLTIEPDGWPKWQDSFLSISSLLPFDSLDRQTESLSCSSLNFYFFYPLCSCSEHTEHTFIQQQLPTYFWNDSSQMATENLTLAKMLLLRELNSNGFCKYVLLV